jgi:amino acid adenylation domain-containing protein
MKNNFSGTDIAIIGMSCHFPGAKNIRSFWENLKNGVESISQLNDLEIVREGEDVDMLKDPQYVKVNSFIEDKEYFDSAFFNFRPDEAELMDPQIRKFFEICWAAVEDAGYSVPADKHKIGLFAGGAFNPDWVNFVLRNRHKYSIDDFTLGYLSNVNFLCSNISNAFNFQGPSIFLDTACSTSLAAVQRACMSLLLRECNMALAGGVTIRNFSKRGYLYRDGMILSKDGHCRAFDAGSSGTVGGEGAGAVVLKRLKDAVEAGDNIYAIIKGSGINNDGASKMSFTAPTVDGQYKVILKAIEMAGVPPESIGYIETHGTATILGDPIEIEALNLAFGKDTTKHCAIGSVKTNIGHLDIAAGIAGLLKTALSIQHRQIPPSLHFKMPNPKANFNHGPLFVNSELTDWGNNGYPLRAGVSSFGIGGTNVHIILEEPPEREAGSASRSYQLLPFSAKSPTALDRNIRKFTEFLEKGTRESLADIAFTLQTGRSPFLYRKMIVCKDNGEDAPTLLAGLADKEPHTIADGARPTVAFMFSGEKCLYDNMCSDLYDTETVYRMEVDTCSAILKGIPGEIRDTGFAQSELFTIEYALARLLISWGISPDVLIGKGIGEYVAACIGGLFSLDEALRLVVKRADPRSAGEIKDPKYWVRQPGRLARFSEANEEILSRKDLVYIEVGPDHDLRYLLSGIGQLWVNGITPDWDAFYEGERRKRVSLPTYSFDKIKYPVHVESVLKTQPVRWTGSTDKTSDISTWAYFPSWQLSPVITTEKQAQPGKCNLIFADDLGVASALHEKLTENRDETIVVRCGSTFLKHASHSYLVNPGSASDFEELYKHLFRDGLMPDRVIHCWGISEEPAMLPTDRFFEDRCNQFLFSVIHHLKAVRQYGGTVGKKLIVLSSGVHGVLDGECLDPLKAPVLGLLRVAAQEYPSISIKHIDISLSEIGDGKLLGPVCSEITGDRPGSVVSFRQSKRWEPTYNRVPTNRQSGDTTFKQNGVYLITGGLGALGATVATRLIRDYNAKVVLLGRTETDKDTGDTSSEKIDRLKKLESESKNVLYIRCNIADERELAETVAISEKKFGAVCGVIHAAGIVEGDSINQLKDLEVKDYLVQFEPKVKALNSLRKVFEHKTLDFCLLTSSLSQILGGFGLAAYAAANAYMDYFVRCFKDKGELTNWISVNLDGINFRGGRTNFIDKDEVFEAISYSLSFRSVSQLVMSATDLFDRLKKRDEAQPGPMAGPDGERPFEGIIDPGPVSGGSRPGEAELLAMWQKFFGDPELEAEDDFFEIGGNSLKAVTMIGRIKSQFNVELKVKTLFENSSVRSLCAHMMALTNSHESQRGSHIVPKAELKELYPLSPAQMRCLFLHEFDKTSLAYNLSTIIMLTGELDKEKLNSVFKKVIGRHESLRTSFESINGRFFQRVAEHADFEIEQLNSSSGNIYTILDSFVRPFDLRSGPLIRVGTKEIDPGKHLLLIDKHHIVTDGVSEGVLMKDFMAIYNNEELPALHLQYKDYAEWQQSDTHQKRLSTQKEFWLSEFSKDFAILDMPTDFPRPEIITFKGDSVDFELNAGSVLRLKAIAAEEGVTLFMVLLAVLNILLSKLSNQEDIIIGTPVANRGHADFEKMIGMFVNTLALRNFPRKQMSFKEFLSEVRSKTLACFDNQSYPYENLIDELGMERNTSRNALFDVMLIIHNTESVNFSFPGLTLEQYDIPPKTSKFDITLSVRESAGRILLNVEYATSLFTRETIDRFIGYFNEIVSEVCADIHTKIGNIDMLPEGEKYQLLREFNDTRIDYPGHKTVMKLFEQQVERTPRKVAVISGRAELSYEELNERANRLAAYLREQYGVGRDQLVGLCLERSEYMLIGVLGVLKAGGAYVPMDPGYPDDRIEYIISDTGTRVVLTNEGQVNRLKRMLVGQELGVEAIDGAAGEERLREYEGTNPTPESGPGDLAYVIYTSGTTGRPKGVMIEQRSFAHVLWYYGQTFFSGAINTLSLTNYVFDIWGLEYGLPLCSGGRIELADSTVPIVAAAKYDFLQFTPSLLMVMYEKIIFNNPRLQLLIGGEALDSNLLTRILTQQEVASVTNVYGPTETTVWSVNQVNTRNKFNTHIGRPIANTKVYVLDEDRVPVPVGVIGELYIGGVGLARGYWNNDALTGQRFVDNPFADEADRAKGYTRLYRTGDMVRWLADGNLEYFGRNDDQVKIRGYRIEPGEIENRMLACPGVQQAVVMIRVQESTDKYLVGYYVSDHEIPMTEIRDNLRERLPEYMIPSFFVHLTELPLTPNGKLNRKALPDPKIEREQEEDIPITGLQRDLVRIWAEVLEIEEQKISININFFDIGGTSIKLLKLVDSLQRFFNREISIAKLFFFPTISSLAGFLSSGYDNEAGTQMSDDFAQMNSTLTIIESDNN